MPGLETEPVKERKKFILEWRSGDFGVAELCRRHGVSRKTGYKWIERYEAEGPDGLLDRSHRPHECPHATPLHVLDEACRIRTSRRTLIGAKKVRKRLLTEHPGWPVPSRRALHTHFVKQGLVPKRRRRPSPTHPGRPTTPFDAPNSIWSVDYKGQFKTLNGRYCYPLTVQDGFSRYLLGCQGLDGPTHRDTKRVLTRVFHEFGLPERVRSDNGTPFASMALGRLSQLSIWFIKLGILPELIEPGSPQQNGRHERMHRDLKAETTIPPAANRSAQQRRFNEFRSYFNEVRPHESLNDATPASAYEPSPRAMPAKLSTPEYPAHFEIRKVSTNGGIRWNRAWVNVSHLLGAEYIGLKEIADNVWTVFFGPVLLGWLHVPVGRILDHDGNSSRNPIR
jgi:transposase InsO family protein